MIIAEHPATDDGTCEWSGLHYHGLVEHPSVYRFDGDRIFNQFKAENCEWFKSEQCKLPVNFLAYMQLPPKSIVYRNLRNDDSDLPCLEVQITPELLNDVKNRKDTRVQAKKEGSQDIMKLKDWIMETGAQSESELLNYFHDNNDFETIYCKRTFNINFKKALSFAIQSTLDTDIRDLCINFKDKKKLCMSPQKSADLMDDWLKWQGLDPQLFVENIICLMNRNKRKLNTIIMKGPPNSGKTFIAKSIEKACIFYGEINQAIAGYGFMWQDCVNKRVIVINEPCFDNCMIEQLKVVLEGTGTFVHKKNSSDEYLRPTPVIITTNTDVWVMALSAKDAIISRCLAIYDKLKSAPMLKKVRKDLHPQWLSLLKIKYAREASPVSDFSDDECPTSQGIGTVAQVPKSKCPIPRADLLMPSTSAVETTIELCEPTPPGLNNKRTVTLLDAPVKRARWETYSPSQSPESLKSDSPSKRLCQETKNSLSARSPKTSKDSKLQQRLTTRVQREEKWPSEQEKDTQAERAAWKLIRKQQLQEQLEDLEEEDKSPQ